MKDLRKKKKSGMIPRFLFKQVGIKAISITKRNPEER